MSESVDSLKQRLVGAFVILSLAVIFLPMVFDKPHRESSSAVQLVPIKPKFETVVITKPKPNKIQPLAVDSATGRVGDSAEVSPKSKPAVKKELAKPSAQTIEKTEKPRTKSTKSLPNKAFPVFNNVWMVQLGTFSNKKNAYALRDKLRASGISAHTKPLDSAKTIRVFAGPFVTKKEAERIKKKVDARYKVASIVVFFDA